MLIFFLSNISHVGWVELISSVAWIYVNVGLGDQYGTRPLNNQFCVLVICIIDHTMDFGVNQWLVLGLRTTTLWWSSPTTMA